MFIQINSMAHTFVASAAMVMIRLHTFQTPYPEPQNQPGSGEGLIIGASLIVIVIMSGILLHSNHPHHNVDND